MELIEKEALRKHALYLHGFGAYKYVPLKVVEKAPTIDAAPVVHGYVQNNGNPICGPCSVCGESVNRRDRYCAMCGARMDGGQEHEAD